MRPRRQEYKISHEIQTRLTETGNILVETRQSDLEGLMRTISLKLVDMENEAVRTALIALGWTPPAAP